MGTGASVPGQKSKFMKAAESGGFFKMVMDAKTDPQKIAAFDKIKAEVLRYLSTILIPVIMFYKVRDLFSCTRDQALCCTKNPSRRTWSHCTGTANRSWYTCIEEETSALLLLLTVDRRRFLLTVEK